MKKFLKLVLPLLLVVGVLVGCGNNVTKKTYTNEQNNVKVELTYYAHGDDVFKQTAQNTIDYSSLDDSTIDAFKTQLDAASKKYQGIKGLKEKITYDDKKKTAKETLTIDYEKVDKSKLKGIPGMLGDFESGKKVSLKKSEKLLKKAGFEEKK
ncbi:DUF1307 domain-containing protein [Lactobacillus sp. YT155]|uniref:DUF1307 domain-containing protein n=1 Tax=Lactobacillus sp. YT155 TaxID=3060955 RepID=UPI0026601163|nr:DUF1307 domain-containing protein [Lactobacillus sp. YT155]MDO1605012.1 DUF1307 domain-containing protein [Lactobacillus sp. YT155]